jgi:hypothetical protein
MSSRLSFQVPESWPTLKIGAWSLRKSRVHIHTTRSSLQPCTGSLALRITQLLHLSGPRNESGILTFTISALPSASIAAPLRRGSFWLSSHAWDVSKTIVSGPKSKSLSKRDIGYHASGIAESWKPIIYQCLGAYCAEKCTCSILEYRN